MLWSRLVVNEGEPVCLHFRPPQQPYLAGPASGEQGQPHRRDAARPFVFETAQCGTMLRQIVRAQQPPARRAANARDSGAGIACGLGTMAPVNGAGEDGAQNLVTPIGPARLASTVFMEPLGHVGARYSIHPKMAESWQDRTV